MKSKIVTIFLIVILFIVKGYSQENVSSDSTKNENDSLFAIQPPPPPMNPPTKASDTLSANEIQCKFPGGQNGWQKFLTKNLNVNIATNNKAPKGTYTVQVRFIVDTDGSVPDVRVSNDPGYGTVQEVIRVIKKSPKWIPGKENGKYVKCIRSQSITFIVEDK